MIKEDTHGTNGNTAAPSGLERARLSLAISAGKLAGASGRLLGVGGGTSLPGLIARRIDPDVLKSVVGASRAKKIEATAATPAHKPSMWSRMLKEAVIPTTKKTVRSASRM